MLLEDAAEESEIEEFALGEICPCQPCNEAFRPWRPLHLIICDFWVFDELIFISYPQITHRELGSDSKLDQHFEIIFSGLYKGKPDLHEPVIFLY